MIRLPRQEVAELLADSVERGEALLERANLIGDLSDYESWKGNRKLWTERTAETLDRVYDGTGELDEFRTAAASSHSGGEPWQDEYKRDSACVQAAIDVLVSLQDRLGVTGPAGPEPEPQEEDESHEEPESREEEPESLEESYRPEAREESYHLEPRREPDRAELELGRQPEPEPDPEPDDPAEESPSVGLEIAQANSADIEFVDRAAGGSASSLPATNSVHANSARGNGHATGQVFLVHGRDDKLKQAVVDLLETAGSHEVTVLNDRPREYKMLVEHFDDEPAGSRYAVVLLTADDVGAPIGDSEREPYFSPRARQGVVFEMGVLVAAVTPRCMCVLYEDGVELPFDLDGIAYVRLDLAGTWQSKLLLHMRGAGFDYDLNRLAPI